MLHSKLASPRLLKFVVRKGAALTAFGLSLISQDGVMTLVAMLFTVGISFLAVKSLW